MNRYRESLSGIFNTGETEEHVPRFVDSTNRKSSRPHCRCPTTAGTPPRLFPTFRRWSAGCLRSPNRCVAPTAPWLTRHLRGRGPGSVLASICANGLNAPSGEICTMMVPVPCRFEMLSKLLTRRSPSIRAPLLWGTRARTTGGNQNWDGKAVPDFVQSLHKILLRVRLRTRRTASANRNRARISVKWEAGGIVRELSDSCHFWHRRMSKMPCGDSRPRLSAERSSTLFLRRRSSSANLNHGRLLEPATALTDDERVHHSAIRAAMAGDQPKFVRVRRHDKSARCCDRFAWLKPDIQRNRRRIRFRGIKPPAIIDQINPDAARPLLPSPGPALDEQIYLVGNLMRPGGSGRFFYRQAPIVKTPRIPRIHDLWWGKKSNHNPGRKISGSPIH